jgi:2-phosphosulfolactate phosphatase
VVVIIDVFRATSTITSALYNGAKCIIPVDSVAKAIEISRNIGAIAAGERDGQIAEGLKHGNSPLGIQSLFYRRQNTGTNYLPMVPSYCRWH